MREKARGLRRTCAVARGAGVVAVTIGPFVNHRLRRVARCAVLKQVHLVKGVGIARGAFGYGEVEWHSGWLWWCGRW